MNAHRVGDLLAGMEWVGVVFAGGMSELAHISCRSIVVNDLHKHVINLAMAVARWREGLVSMLDDLPFHPDALAGAQEMCMAIENNRAPIVNDHDKIHWAAAFFICSWMGRSGLSGSVGEFKGNLSTRWNANGGDSNTRYRSAIAGLEEWQRIMRRCNFSTLDFREFLNNCKDLPKHGIYSDSPFPNADVKYKHTFTEQDHIDLAMALHRFERAKVVIRYYDHPLIRELYPEDRWKWHCFDGRKQSNAEAPEVLIVNKAGA